MKILIVSAQPPSPYGGGEIRLMNLIKVLSATHQISVLAPMHRRDDPALEHANRYCHFIPIWMPPPPSPHSRLYYQIDAWRQALLAREPRQVKTFYSPLVGQAVNQELDRLEYDLIQVQQLHMVQYLPQATQLPGILDVDNLWSKLLPRLADSHIDRRVTQRLQTRLDLRKVPGYEQRSLRRFNGCLAVSRADEQTIRHLAPDVRTAVIPNGVDCSYFTPAPAAGSAAPTLLFTGTMSWEPNAEAATCFASQILPQIRQHYPQAIFKIVGRGPRPEVLDLARDPQIEVSGFVEDIRPYLTEAAVFVVPLRAGGGTRLKILEALAMGKAVVSTSLGAEGLQVRRNEHLLLADEPGEFAAAVQKLLGDAALRQELGGNGRRLVEQVYDWRPIARELERFYLEVKELR